MSLKLPEVPMVLQRFGRRIDDWVLTTPNVPSAVRRRQLEQMDHDERSTWLDRYIQRHEEKIYKDSRATFPNEPSQNGGYWLKKLAGSLLSGAATGVAVNYGKILLGYTTGPIGAAIGGGLNSAVRGVSEVLPGRGGIAKVMRETTELNAKAQAASDKKGKILTGLQTFTQAEKIIAKDTANKVGKVLIEEDRKRAEPGLQGLLTNMPARGEEIPVMVELGITRRFEDVLGKVAQESGIMSIYGMEYHELPQETKQMLTRHANERILHQDLDLIKYLEDWQFLGYSNAKEVLGKNLIALDDTFAHAFFETLHLSLLGNVRRILTTGDIANDSGLVNQVVFELSEARLGLGKKAAITGSYLLTRTLVGAGKGFVGYEAVQAFLGVGKWVGESVSSLFRPILPRVTPVPTVRPPEAFTSTPRPTLNPTETSTPTLTPVRPTSTVIPTETQTPTLKPTRPSATPAPTETSTPTSVSRPTATPEPMQTPKTVPSTRPNVAPQSEVIPVNTRPDQVFVGHPEIEIDGHRVVEINVPKGTNIVDAYTSSGYSKEFARTQGVIWFAENNFRDATGDYMAQCYKIARSAEAIALDHGASRDVWKELKFDPLKHTFKVELLDQWIADAQSSATDPDSVAKKAKALAKLRALGHWIPAGKAAKFRLQ